MLLYLILFAGNEYLKFHLICLLFSCISTPG